MPDSNNRLHVVNSWFATLLVCIVPAIVIVLMRDGRPPLSSAVIGAAPPAAHAAPVAREQPFAALREIAGPASSAPTTNPPAIKAAWHPAAKVPAKQVKKAHPATTIALVSRTRTTHAVKHAPKASHRAAAHKTVTHKTVAHKTVAAGPPPTPKPGQPTAPHPAPPGGQQSRGGYGHGPGHQGGGHHRGH